MLQRQLSIILLINIHTSSCVIDAIYDAGKQVWKLYDFIKDDPITDNNSIIQQMNRDMDVIHGQLSVLDDSYPSAFILDLVTKWPLNVTAFVDIDKNDLFIQGIDDCYKKLNQLRNGTNYYSHDQFEKIVEGISLEVENNIAMIRKFVVDRSDSSSNFHRSLPGEIIAIAKNHQAQICDSPAMISDVLINLFKLGMIAEIRASATVTFINVHLYFLHGRNKGWLRINSFNRERFEEQFGIYVNSFLSKTAVLDSIYWRSCDPKDNIWIPGETCIELDRTFHTSLFHYRYFNCKYDSCDTIINDKAYQCMPETYDIRTDCDGIRNHCTYLSAIKACVLENGPRKFQYVDSTKLGFLGNNSSCSEVNGRIIEDGTGWDISFAACACECYTNYNKISLSLMESKVTSNRVIVGLRFIRHNEILYIQPREATLHANGRFDRLRQTWINIQENPSPGQIHPINRENRVFFFDDVRLPPGFALTGVKFIKVTRGGVSGFTIEIIGRHFDYKRGKLFLNEELKISRQASNKTLGESLSFTPVSSLFTTLPHTATPSSIKYVELQQSRLKEDFGQATLPLFDSIPISINFPSALSGIGIFHKGAEGYAGYISLRVYGVQYEKYFENFKFTHMKNDRVLFNDSHYT